MRTIKLLLVSCVIYASAAACAHASGPNTAAINRSLYYPVQTGNYQDIKLLPRANAPMNNPCEIGTLYLNDQNVAMYCFRVPNSDPAVGEWAPMTGPWKIENDSVTISPFYHSPDLKVGLGTTDPPFKLTVIDQGGIIAKGTIDSGDTIPDIWPPTSPYWSPHASMFWNPRKAALRAGINQGMRWNDTPYVGKYSVALGSNPLAWSDFSSALSGDLTEAYGTYSVVAGGRRTQTNGTASAVGGGNQNGACCDGVYVGGGDRNGTHHIYTTIYGGNNNRTMNVGGTIVGGETNRTSAYATIIGGKNNIAGNQYWNLPENLADMDAYWAGATEEYEVIGGGLQNLNGNAYTTIGGGELNETRGQYATVIGGKQNSAGGHYSTILGGYFNQTRSRAAVITGGYNNTILAKYSVINGGTNNTTTADYASVLGGYQGGAGGIGAIITGGSHNSAGGNYSWAAGKNMQLTPAVPVAGHRSFLWGYSETFPVPVSTQDAFMIYSGHVGVNDRSKLGIFALGSYNTFDLLHFTSQTGLPGNKLTIKKDGRWGIDKQHPAHALDFGTIAQNAHLTSGGQWVPGSSRTFKENIKSLTSEIANSIFAALEPVSFNYKNTPDDLTLGFIAEDVPELVATADRKTMTRTPLLSVLTKVIQEQDQVLEEQNNEIQTLKQRIEKLKQVRMEK